MPSWSMRSTPEQRGWYLYDWANSAFATTVVTLFLGPYLTSLAKAAAGADGLVHPLGMPVDPRSYWSYLVGLSVGAQVLLLPVIGAMADLRAPQESSSGADRVSGRERPRRRCSSRRTACIWLGGALFIVANVSFGAAVAIYNSFLPEIAPPEERDAVSSKAGASDIWAAACCWR